MSFFSELIYILDGQFIFKIMSVIRDLQWNKPIVLPPHIFSPDTQASQEGFVFFENTKFLFFIQSILLIL